MTAPGRDAGFAHQLGYFPGRSVGMKAQSGAPGRGRKGPVPPDFAARDAGPGQAAADRQPTSIPVGPGALPPAWNDGFVIQPQMSAPGMQAGIRPVKDRLSVGAGGGALRAEF